MLTDEGDSVLDPFAGSCATGEICERLKRNWICAELRTGLCRRRAGALSIQTTRRPTVVVLAANSNFVGPKSTQRIVDFYKLPRGGRSLEQVPRKADAGEERRKTSQEYEGPKSTA